jgi:hypothetical protein
MKKIVSAALAGVFVASTAFAQTTPAPTANGDTPAVTTSETANPTAPVAGENSFTESQAKSRIEEAGVASVTELKLDDSGIWQATGTKDGKSVKVSLDYQGNIVTE